MIPDADASTCDGDPAPPNAVAPMISDADAPSTPIDAAPGSGWNHGALMGILTALVSFSEIQNGSLSVWETSVKVAGGSVPDTPLVRVLFWASATL